MHEPRRRPAQAARAERGRDEEAGRAGGALDPVAIDAASGQAGARGRRATVLGFAPQLKLHVGKAGRIAEEEEVEEAAGLRAPPGRGEES